MKSSKSYKRLFIFSFLAAFVLSPMGIIAINALTPTPEWDYDTDTSTYTTKESVSIGTKYQLPNTQASIIFTELPATPEKVSFKLINTDKTGVVNGSVFEITTNMANGSFKYNLEMPFGPNNNLLREVYFADSLATIESSTKISTNSLSKAGNNIIVSGLDHFTVFYVSEVAVASDSACIAVGATFSNGCYSSIQDAINNASLGDEIRIASGTYSENLNINKPLSLVCANKGRSPIGFVRNPESIIQSPTSLASDSAILISSSNVTVDGCLIDANNSGYGISNNNSGYISGLSNINIASNIVRNAAIAGSDFGSSPSLGALNNSFVQNLIENSNVGFNLSNNFITYVEYNKTVGVNSALELGDYSINPGSELQIKNNNFAYSDSGVSLTNLTTSIPPIIFSSNTLTGDNSSVGFSAKNIQDNVNINFSGNNINNNSVGAYLWQVNPANPFEIKSSNFSNNQVGVQIANLDGISGAATTNSNIIIDAVNITGSSSNAIEILDETTVDSSNQILISLVNNVKVSNSANGILIKGSDVTINSSASEFNQIGGNYIAIGSNSSSNFLSSDIDFLNTKLDGYNGNQMSNFLRNRTDSKIIDKLDNPAKGEVIYYNQAAVADAPPIFTFQKPLDSQFIKGDYEFTVKVNDDFGIGSYNLGVFDPTGSTLVTTCAFDNKTGVDLGKDLTVKCSLNTATSLVDGEYTLKFSTVDPENTKTESIKFNVDNTSPVISIESHTNNDFVCSMATFDFSGMVQDLPPSSLPIVTSDVDYATIRFVGTSTYGPYNANLVGIFWSYITNPATLPGGTYSVVVEAFDVAGNKGTATISNIKVNSNDCPDPILEFNDINIDEVVSVIPSEVVITNDQLISYSCINVATSSQLILSDLQVPANDSNKIVDISCIGTNTYSGKSVTSEYKITVNSVSPIIEITPSSINANETQILNISANVSSGNLPYSPITWSGVCAYFVADSGVLGPLAPGTYNCGASVIDVDGDIATDQITIEIKNDIPDVGLDYVMSSATELSNVTISANIVGGDPFPSAPFFEYYWSGDCSGFSVNDAFETLNNLTDGTYSCGLYVIDSDGDVSNNSSISFTVLNNVPTVSINPSSVTISQGTNVTFAANITNGNSPFNYSWSGACSGFGNSQTGQIVNPAVGNYSCTVTVTDVDGDVSNTATASFTVNAVSTTPINLNPQAFIAATPSTTVTAPQTITLTAIGIGGDLPYRSYSWFGDCSGNGVTTVVPSAAGTYICGVNITDANGDVSQNPQITLQVTVLAANPVIGTTPAPVQQNPQPVQESLSNQTEENQLTEDGVLGNVNGVSTDSQTGTVLGTQTCTTRIKLSGFIYAAQDSNGTRYSNENGVGGVLVSVFYNDENNQMQLLSSTRSSSAGYWEVNGCPTNYEIKIDKTSIPVGYELSSAETLRVVGRLSDINNINFELKSTNSFNLGSIALFVLGGAFVLLLLFIILRKKDKREEQQIGQSGIGNMVRYQTPYQ